MGEFLPATRFCPLRELKKLTLRDHTIIGGAVSIILYPFIGLEAVCFFGASVLIDIDHYIDFIYHNGMKDFSPARMFRYHKILSQWLRDPEFLNMEIFHTVEFLTLILALAFMLNSPALTAIFFGLILHIGLDVVFLLRHKVLNKRIHSITGYFIKKKAFAEIGLDPARLYKKAAELTTTEAGLKVFKNPLNHQSRN
jgi:hypothetical protein